MTLAQAGITEINLTADTTRIMLPDGSMIEGQTTYTRNNGTTGTVGNVTLTAEAGGHNVIQTVTTDGAGNRVIDSKGYGTGGALAFVLHSVTNPNGSNIAISYDSTAAKILGQLGVTSVVARRCNRKTPRHCKLSSQRRRKGLACSPKKPFGNRLVA